MATPAPDHADNAVYEFEGFRLDTGRCRLYRDGEMVSLAPKAVELLAALVERPGQLVEKDDLMRRIWPDSIVEESNLSVNMSTLRRSLGESPTDRRFIVTVSGRGYRFVAPVTRVLNEAAKAIDGAPVEPAIASAEVESPTAARQAATWRRAWHWRSAAWIATVVVAAVGGAWGAGLLVRQRPANRPTAAAKTIAVLPFQAVGTIGVDDALPLGIVETLVSRLAGLPQVVVRPTSSVRRFAGTTDPVAAGRELQVDAVLDGHVQRNGDRIRITVQLISVDTQRPIWSDHFDERFTDIFAVEDTLSERVAAAIVPALAGDVRRRLVKRYTSNEAAYDAYMSGRFQADRFNRDGSLKAIAHFKKALELDPSYALAWAGLADAYIWFCIDQAPPRELLPQAEAAARRALDLDDSLADAHASLAMIFYRYYYQWPKAEIEFRRALTINGNDGALRQKYGWYLSMLGRADEARTEMQLAGQLDPLSLPIQIDVGLPDYSARRYEPSIATARRMLANHPRFGTGYFTMALAQLGAGHVTDALATLHRGTPFDDTPEVIAHTAIAHARLGRRADAMTGIERLITLSKERYVSPASIGLIYAALGEPTAAFGWLEKGYQDRSWWMIFLRVDARFDSLRSDARFAGLLRRVGLS